jgi:hypothetical protein
LSLTLRKEDEFRMSENGVLRISVRRIGVAVHINGLAIDGKIILKGLLKYVRV